MYEPFFGFTQRPFSAVPRSDRYFPAAAVEAARQTLIRCIDRAEGCGLIVGPAGTGKTLLCHVLADHFQSRVDVVLLSSIHLGSSKEVLQAIAFELGLPYRRLDEGELRLSLIDRISPNEKCRDGMLLIVDEAHALPPKVLEELRLLTNLVRGGTPRVRLVLAGAPVLDERFASPRLESFNQRLVARCYLETFSAEETLEYVRAHTAVAGADPDRLWTAEALRAIHHATDGCPRLINQLCDLTLMLAASASASQVDDDNVNEAWAELQQLPMPWNVDPRGASSSVASDESAAPTTVVEFGSLDDEVAAESDPVAPQRDEQSELLPELDELDEAARNVATEAPGDPTLQVDRIEAHLANVEQTFVHDDFTLPRLAENLSCQVELDFGDSVPAPASAPAPAMAQFHNGAASAAAVHDEADDDADIAIEQSVVFKDFAGLEGNTVVRLSPSPRAVSADEVAAGPDDEVGDEAEDEAVVDRPVLEVDRPKASWLNGLARMMERTAKPDLKPFDEPAPNAPVSIGIRDAAETKGQAAAPRPIESNFIELQYVHEAAQVIDNDRHDPVAPMPSIVVDYTPDHSMDLDRRGSVESRYVRSGDGDTVGPSVGGDVEDVVEAEGQPAAGNETLAAAPEIRSPAQGHPTIPVRQREYRQLFAKLRQREMQENR
jgi:type II secretory pathway predicted ATPase ExeA